MITASCQRSPANARIDSRSSQTVAWCQEDMIPTVIAIGAAGLDRA